MRRFYIILILMFSSILCACHRNINTVDEFECVTTAPIIETESQTKNDNYIEDEKIYSACCNSKCAVWKANEGFWVYDFEKDRIISLDLSGFYVLVDDCVISADDGLYSYKLGDSSYEYLIKSDDKHCALLSSDFDGKLLAQWYIPGQYNGYSWLENEVTILQISIDSID